MFENKVIEFVYSAGSNPGEKRVVFVTDVTPTAYTGYDFDRKAVRRFLTSRLTGAIKVQSAAKIVEVNSLPSAVRADTIERGLAADGYEVYNDGGYVVGATLPTKRKLEVYGATWKFSGPGGNLTIMNSNGRLSLYECGKGINFNPNDPMPMFEALKRVLN